MLFGVCNYGNDTVPEFVRCATDQTTRGGWCSLARWRAQCKKMRDGRKNSLQRVDRRREGIDASLRHDGDARQTIDAACG